MVCIVYAKYTIVEGQQIYSGITSRLNITLKDTSEQTLCIWSCGFFGCSTWPKKLVWTVGFWLLDNAASSWSGMTSSSKFAGSKIVGHMRMEPYYAGWRSFQSFIFATVNQKYFLILKCYKNWNWRLLSKSNAFLNWFRLNVISAVYSTLCTECQGLRPTAVMTHRFKAFLKWHCTTMSMVFVIKSWLSAFWQPWHSSTIQSLKFFFDPLFHNPLYWVAENLGIHLDHSLPSIYWEGMKLWVGALFVEIQKSSLSAKKSTCNKAWWIRNNNYIVHIHNLSRVILCQEFNVHKESSARKNTMTIGTPIHDQAQVTAFLQLSFFLQRLARFETITQKQTTKSNQGFKW